MKIGRIFWDKCFSRNLLTQNPKLRNLKILIFRKFLNYITSKCKNHEKFDRDFIKKIILTVLLIKIRLLYKTD